MGCGMQLGVDKSSIGGDGGKTATLARDVLSTSISISCGTHTLQ